MNRWGTRGSLPRFLIVSVALHASLLTQLDQPLQTVWNRWLGHQVLDIWLQRAASVSAPDPANALSAPAPVPSAETQTRPRRRDPPPVPRAAPIDAASNPPRSAPAGDPASVSAVAAAETETVARLRNQLRGTLQTRLSQYLTYPPLARRYGWEGTVLVALRIESDGRLNDIRVEHGSGYPILDDSALKSLNRLGRLVEAASWLDGRSIDMQLAVVYRLIEN